MPAKRPIDILTPKEVLTLNRDDFRLSKPYERRAYERARKPCGRNKEGKMDLELLRKKMGATSPLKKFRFFLKDLSDSDHLPDDTVELTEADQVIFRNCEMWWKTEADEDAPPRALYRSRRARQEIHRPRERLCMGAGLDSILA